MTSPSNLYAEKIFAEHPTVLWSLDDKVDYLSLITEEQRDISDNLIWTVSGGTVESSDALIGRPFGESSMSYLVGVEDAGQVLLTATSETITTSSDLNTDMATFAIGGYFYTTGQYISAIKLGYTYNDGVEDIYVTKSFRAPATNTWFFLSETFDIPEDDVDIKIYIEVNYFEVVTDPDADYSLYINGITFGQWAEEFNATSLGINKVAIAENIALDVSYGVKALAYGLQDNSGYYLVNESNQIMAKNTGMPLVFGASNNTTIIPNNDLPSLILPGNGFLNENGAYKDYTFEMWLRLNAGVNTLRKIMGPISSEDGIYVQGGFIILKIDNYYASHFVGEWSRPMLLQVTLLSNKASMFLNGEQILSIEFDEYPSFPDKVNGTGQDQDWIGFYVYDDIAPLEIDCVAIYSYEVPAIVAKRRWVYGQAVESPETINSAFSGTSIFADYNFADYTSNYNYPDLADWTQGILDNVESEFGVLKTPQYQLPSVFFKQLIDDAPAEISGSQDAMLDALMEDLALEQEGNYFISFRPTIDWESKVAYFYLETLDILIDNVAGVSVKVKEASEVLDTQTLLFLRNKFDGSYFEVTIDAENITYNFVSSSGISTQISQFAKYDLESLFMVGVNFRQIALSFGGEIAKFFSNPQLIEAFVANDPLFESQFTQNIYSINLYSSKNIASLSSEFEDGIIKDTSNMESLLDSDAAYSAIPTFIFDQFVLDISVKSSWQSYIPLSRLSQNVKDSRGDTVYTLDMMQLNVNYPEPAFLSGGSVDTSLSPFKTYISFQTLSSGANSSIDEYSSIVSAPANNVVIPGNNWLTTAYEVTNNTVIYPPTGININNIALVLHAEIDLEKSLFNRLKIRSLEIASQAYNATSPNPVGTKLGNPIYPFKKSGVYFDYKSANPITVYKKNTPYLHLTRNSGFSIVGDRTARESRGISVPVNSALADSYKMSAFQMSIRYDQDAFPTTPIEIFEVQSKDRYIKFMLVSTHPDNKRGKIYAVNAITGAAEDRLSFYWNGNIVKSPVIEIKQWGMIGINFAAKPDFSNYVGAIRLTGPLTYNNISHYELTALQELQQTNDRIWLKVKYVGATEVEWEYWADSFIWEDVLILATQNIYSANPSDIYKAYIGTNKIIASDSFIYTVNDYQYSLFLNSQLDSVSIKPV